jgi:hypothetical protein
MRKSDHEDRSQGYKSKGEQIQVLVNEDEEGKHEVLGCTRVQWGKSRGLEDCREEEGDESGNEGKKTEQLKLR